MNHKKWNDSSQFSAYSNEKKSSDDFSKFAFFSKLENPLKYGLTFVVTALIVGFLWYISLSPSVVSDQNLIKIKPSEGAFKIKPTEEIVDEEKQHSKTIYEKLEAKNPDEKVEHLLKEPEEPIALPPSLPDDFIGNLLNEEEIPNSFLDSDNKTINESSEETSKQEEIPDKVLKKNEKNSKSLIPIHNETENAHKSESKDSSPLLIASNSDESMSQKEVFWIQLASLRSKEAAEKEWKRLSKSSKTKSVLGTFKPCFSQSEQGETTLHRIRIGPFPGSKAKDIYEKLKALKIDCLLKKLS